MSSLSIQPHKTALIAIDLQGAILSRGPKPHSADDVVARTRAIADKLRAAGGTIVWVHVDLNDFLKLPSDTPVQVPPGKIPQEAIDIVPSAGKQPEDLLITKRSWGAFAHTSLESDLRNRGIDTIILTGVATNFGVESTLRQGTGLGFGFITVEDASSTFGQEMQDFALQYIFPRLSLVRSTEQVLAALESKLS